MFLNRGLLDNYSLHSSSPFVLQCAAAGRDPAPGPRAAVLPAALPSPWVGPPLYSLFTVPRAGPTNIDTTGGRDAYFRERDDDNFIDVKYMHHHRDPNTGSCLIFLGGIRERPEG